MPLEEYKKSVEAGNQFLDDHNNLLTSLLLSKQNARNSASVNETPEGTSDGAE